ncbi:hypothetical protein [Gilliamella sp. M0320]|nr:hypothetical protein [Gilliamella sp. M0320]
MTNRDVCQGCDLSGTNHSRCVKSERRGGRQSHRDHLRGRRGRL